ncbi:putative double-stranded RNA/RNA-DNA hybrid binding protein [Ceratocystis lukuohia]|uniref:Double-stranded RNA/RNA-DNA hybrid binding protein n=1 Tax=Ceratocystis lukuohia TaxID=2019550 RepID=A0ABR4MIW5_9PEZI
MQTIPAHNNNRRLHRQGTRKWRTRKQSLPSEQSGSQWKLPHHKQRAAGSSGPQGTAKFRERSSRPTGQSGLQERRSSGSRKGGVSGGGEALEERRIQGRFKNWMRDNCPNTDHLGGALGLPKPHKVNWMRGLNRGFAAKLLAARSRHGDLEEYHSKFNHQGAETKCQVPSCGKPKDFSHPWRCMGNATRLAGRKGIEVGAAF